MRGKPFQGSTTLIRYDPGFSLGSNPGLKLANAFGVIVTCAATDSFAEPWAEISERLRVKVTCAATDSFAEPWAGISERLRRNSGF